MFLASIFAATFFAFSTTSTYPAAGCILFISNPIPFVYPVPFTVCHTAICVPRYAASTLFAPSCATVLFGYPLLITDTNLFDLTVFMYDKDVLSSGAIIP